MMVMMIITIGNRGNFTKEKELRGTYPLIFPVSFLAPHHFLLNLRSRIVVEIVSLNKLVVLLL